MMFFNTRAKAVAFAGSNDSYTTKDMGKTSPDGRRWAVKVL